MNDYLNQLETFEKQNNNKSAVKISAQKRQGSRRTLKQKINTDITLYNEKDEINE